MTNSCILNSNNELKNQVSERMPGRCINFISGNKKKKKKHIYIYTVKSETVFSVSFIYESVCFDSPAVSLVLVPIPITFDVISLIP